MPRDAFYLMLMRPLETGRFVSVTQYDEQSPRAELHETIEYIGTDNTNELGEFLYRISTIAIYKDKYEFSDFTVNFDSVSIFSEVDRVWVFSPKVIKAEILAMIGRHRFWGHLTRKPKLLAYDLKTGECLELYGGYALVGNCLFQLSDHRRLNLGNISAIVTNGVPEEHPLHFAYSAQSVSPDTEGFFEGILLEELQVANLGNQDLTWLNSLVDAEPTHLFSLVADSFEDTYQHLLERMLKACAYAEAHNYFLMPYFM